MDIGENNGGSASSDAAASDSQALFQLGGRSFGDDIRDELTTYFKNIRNDNTATDGEYYRRCWDILEKNWKEIMDTGNQMPNITQIVKAREAVGGRGTLRAELQGVQREMRRSARERHRPDLAARIRMRLNDLRATFRKADDDVKAAYLESLTPGHMPFRQFLEDDSITALAFLQNEAALARGQAPAAPPRCRVTVDQKEQIARELQTLERALLTQLGIDDVDGAMDRIRDTNANADTIRAIESIVEGRIVLPTAPAIAPVVAPAPAVAPAASIPVSADSAEVGIDADVMDLDDGVENAAAEAAAEAAAQAAAEAAAAEAEAEAEERRLAEIQRAQEEAERAAVEAEAAARRAQEAQEAVSELAELSDISGREREPRRPVRRDGDDGADGLTRDREARQRPEVSVIPERERSPPPVRSISKPQPQPQQFEEETTLGALYQRYVEKDNGEGNIRGAGIQSERQAAARNNTDSTTAQENAVKALKDIPYEPNGSDTLTSTLLSNLERYLERYGVTIKKKDSNVVKYFQNQWSGEGLKQLIFAVCGSQCSSPHEIPLALAGNDTADILATKDKPNKRTYIAFYKNEIPIAFIHIVDQYAQLQQQRRPVLSVQHPFVIQKNSDLSAQGYAPNVVPFNPSQSEYRAKDTPLNLTDADLSDMERGLVIDTLCAKRMYKRKGTEDIVVVKSSCGTVLVSGEGDPQIEYMQLRRSTQNNLWGFDCPANAPCKNFEEMEVPELGSALLLYALLAEKKDKMDSKKSNFGSVQLFVVQDGTPEEVKAAYRGEDLVFAQASERVVDYYEKKFGIMRTFPTTAVQRTSPPLLQDGFRGYVLQRLNEETNFQLRRLWDKYRAYKRARHQLRQLSLSTEEAPASEIKMLEAVPPLTAEEESYFEMATSFMTRPYPTDEEMLGFFGRILTDAQRPPLPSTCLQQNAEILMGRKRERPPPSKPNTTIGLRKRQEPMDES